MEARRSQFQFHKGTIRTGTPFRSNKCTALFQFHKGTIRTFIHNYSSTFTPKFQFHKGTIRTPASPRPLPLRQDFNSIKVRLERIERCAACAVGALFQFHKGTIRTGLTLLTDSNTPWFQFHKGTIRTIGITIIGISFKYFNSIKVRLERNQSSHFCPGT
mgnify:CR=1 FL=1